MEFERVTIRNVEREAAAILRETARFNGMRLGEATTAAIMAWVDGLPEGDAPEQPLGR